MHQSTRNRTTCCLFILLSIIFTWIPPAASPLNAGIRLTPEERTWIREHPVIRVAGPRAFPPFHFYEDGFQAKGICHDYAKLILEQIGCSLEIIPDLPWPEVLKNTAKGQIDLIACAAESPDRPFITYSDPYLSFPFVIFSRKNAPFISGLEDLHDRKVALIQKTNTYNWLVRDKIEVQPHFVDTPLEGLTAVSLGTCDAYIGNLAASSWLIEQNGLTNLKVAAPTSYGNYELYFAARSDWPILINLINKALVNITPQQHASIRNKWLSVRYDHGIRLRDILIWLIPTLALAMALILFVSMWNRRLRREINQRISAQAALELSEERFRRLNQASFSGICIHDRGLILDANESLAEMTGYSIEELIDMNGILLIAPDGRQPVIDYIRSAVQNPFETEGIRKDGTVYPLEIIEKEIPYDDRIVNVTEFRDISKRKAADRERESLVSELKEALENVDDLTRLVPICARCKQPRDDKTLWDQIELYLNKHPDAPFCQGLCPNCVAELQKKEKEGDQPAKN